MEGKNVIIFLQLIVLIMCTLNWDKWCREKFHVDNETLSGSYYYRLYEFCEDYTMHRYTKDTASLSNVSKQPASVTNFNHGNIHAGVSISAVVLEFTKLIILPVVVLVCINLKLKLVSENIVQVKKGYVLKDGNPEINLKDEWKGKGHRKFSSKSCLNYKLATRAHENNDYDCEACSKHAINDLFEFRRNHCFKQNCTACPAVSLTSYFSSGTYGHPGSTPELQKEGVRLATFKNFPTTILVSALRLAQAGFYYTGERDITKCFSCGVTHQGWQLGDRPSLVHARIAPSCPLVKGSDMDNLPLPLPVSSLPVFNDGASSSVDSGYWSRSYDSSANVSSGLQNGDEVQHDSAPDAVTDSLGMPSSGPHGLAGTASLGASVSTARPIPSSLATPENSMFSGAPLFGRATPMDGGAPRNQPMPAKRLDLGGAVYPLYSQMDARKRSYTNWVADNGLPSVDELITLGFFYAGYADCVRCFFCGIGLKSWEPGDIPAEVHARWRPTCEYLRLVKGDEFVDQVANGGRNVAAGNSLTQGNAAPTTAPPTRQAPDENGGSSDPVNTSQVQVPDTPVVRRARETGYTNEQIAEGIEKLRVIGMERAMEVMLVEVLTNLFQDNPPQPSGQQLQTPNATPSNSNGVSAGNGDSGFESGAHNKHTSELDTDDGIQVDAVSAQPDLQDRQNSLQQENARLRNMRTCQRCREQPVGVIFLPCGHIVSCTACAPNIRRCLRCDTVIRATANVFFS